jgi:hypothetical protein
MVLPYDPKTGKRPTNAQIRAGEREGVGCDMVWLRGPLRLGYLAFFSDAEKRAVHGEEQTRCVKCRRYRWPDEAAACSDFTHERKTR